MQWLGTASLSSGLVRSFATRAGSGLPPGGSKTAGRPKKVVKFYQRQSKPTIKPLPVVSVAKAPQPSTASKPRQDLTAETANSDDYSTRIVRKDENEMRIDRWLRAHFPTLTQSFIEKLLRKKQVLYHISMRL
jgi:hypothetical protein